MSHERIDVRGNSRTRRVRRAWIMSPEAGFGGNGVEVPCFHCFKTIAEGRWYYGARALDYAVIGEWARSLPGQAMVCENAGASWLPFETFKTARANSSRGNGRVSHEVLWTSERAA